MPIENFGGVNTNITYYEDVRVPAGNLVGEENEGWSLITNQLNHERVTLCSSGVVERMLDDVRRWAQETKLADGRRVIDQEWVQVNLGPRARQARVPAPRELAGRVARAERRAAEPGRRVDDQGVRHRVLHGGRAAADGGDARPGAALRATRPARSCAAGSSACCASMHILTFGGGTNEMQRDLIAIFGLDMPGSPR